MISKFNSTLVLGGARSGKSRHALDLAAASRLDPVLIATARAGDEEMLARIARHKSERADGWRVIEEPLLLMETLTDWAAPDRIVLVDCLTLWLCNLMEAGVDVDKSSEGLASAVSRLGGPVIFVSNEVGLGIVPATELGRNFRDAEGWLNQAMARSCDQVTLMVAGLPLSLKSS